MTQNELMELIDQKFQSFKEGQLVKAKIVSIKPQVVLLDIGYKSEGVVPIAEFNGEEINLGDEVEVLLEKLENHDGIVSISKEKATHKQNWEKIIEVYKKEGLVRGKVKSVVNGGLIVDVGIEAFLPGSQIDVVTPKELNQYIGEVFEFKIVKINESRKNVVISRREVLEEKRAELKQKFLKDVKIGDKVTGVVKNITDFGAFLDLRGMDGLLHIADMSWNRTTHPSKVVHVGQKLDVVILDIDREKERISLSLKELSENPWNKIEKQYPIGMQVKGKVTKLLPYGAFVELDPHIEGLVHVSELSWTKRINHPSDLLQIDQEIEAVVLGVSLEEQKISLGVRQTQHNPWEEIEQRYPVGKKVKGTIINLTPYGAFVSLEDDIDGLVHVSDLSWTRKINHTSEVLTKGEDIEAIILSIDKQSQRISLGVKQFIDDPWDTIEEKFKVGDTVKGTATKIAAFGAFINLKNDIDGLIHISQLSEERVERVKDFVKIGDKIESRVIRMDKAERRIGLSIKALNYSQEELEKASQSLEGSIGNYGNSLVGLDQAFNLAAAAVADWNPSADTSDSEEKTTD